MMAAVWRGVLVLASALACVALDTDGAVLVLGSGGVVGRSLTKARSAAALQ
jgi:hypothetical protein